MPNLIWAIGSITLTIDRIYGKLSQCNRVGRAGMDSSDFRQGRIVSELLRTPTLLSISAIPLPSASFRMAILLYLGGSLILGFLIG